MLLCQGWQVSPLMLYPVTIPCSLAHRELMAVPDFYVRRRRRRTAATITGRMVSSDGSKLEDHR